MLVKSLNIILLKIFSKLQRSYPLLQIASITDTAEVDHLTNNLNEIKTKVAKAKRILLFVHGIIVDTKEISSSAVRAKINIDGQEKLLGDAYDLMLTFDYENLNTPIEENAKLLKEQLIAVGLGENREKILHVIAHSIGGLVLRWFIEYQGGDKVINHLVMIGTPNGGLSWVGNLRLAKGWAYTNLAIILNNLTKTLVGPVAVANLIKLLESMDKNLDKMDKGSEILIKLAESNGSKVPYTIIAGNARELFIDKQALLEKMLSRFKLPQFDSLKENFLKEPNDLFVTVESAKAISFNNGPQTRTYEVDCDYLSYFTDPDVCKILAEVLKDVQEAD